MLSLLLAALCALPPQDPPPAPDPERVRTAVEALDEAFAKGGSEERLKAIEAAAQLVHSDVIARLARGLKDGDEAVRAAAVEALRFQRHPDALDALQQLYARDRKLRKDTEACAMVLKAIGQHGQPKSISLLADEGLDSAGHKVVVARILGLGNVRTRDSLEALLGMMRTAGRDRVQPYMDSFRLALMRLTGVDQGPSQDAWMRWWNDVKKTVEVASEPPRLPAERQRQWDGYWGYELRYERRARRGDRGR